MSGKQHLCRTERFVQASAKWKSLNSAEISSLEALFSWGEWIFLVLIAVGFFRYEELEFTLGRLNWFVEGMVASTVLAL